MDQGNKIQLSIYQTYVEQEDKQSSLCIHFLHVDQGNQIYLCIYMVIKTTKFACSSIPCILIKPIKAAYVSCIHMIIKTIKPDSASTIRIFMNNLSKSSASSACRIIKTTKSTCVSAIWILIKKTLNDVSLKPDQ